MNMNKFKESEYYMSDKHLKNFESARIFGIEKIKKLKDERILEYNNSPNLCLECKKSLSYEKRKNRFCGSSCAAIFNNKNRANDFITDEFREKQRKNAIKNFGEKKKKEKKISYYDIDIKCPECGKSLSKDQKMRKRTYCSNLCRGNGFKVTDETRKKLSEVIKKRIKDGKHKGWQSRNIESYPETFFKRVLENNNIKYEFNKIISKRSLGLDCDANYFLDFFIVNKNIDLEIDGQQHKLKERMESDDTRTDALVKNGIIVYRIEWKNINTKRGSEYIKNEIDKFLDFMKNL